jgi:hypothetical protein
VPDIKAISSASFKAAYTLSNHFAIGEFKNSAGGVVLSKASSEERKAALTSSDKYSIFGM